MKLQAITNRSESKQGADLLDILQLTLDDATHQIALEHISSVDHSVAQDISIDIDLWLTQRRHKALQWIHAVGGQDITTDDLELNSDDSATYRWFRLIQRRNGTESTQKFTRVEASPASRT